LQNEQNKAIELVEESLALWQHLDDPVGIATVMLHRGWVAQAMSDNAEAGRIYEEGLHFLKNTDETWLRAQLLCYVAAAAGFTFDFERMRSFYEKGKTLFEQLGDKCALADFLKDQGGLLILDSKYDDAITCLLKSLAFCKELDQRQYIMSGMAWLAYAIGMRGEPTPEMASISTAKLKGVVQEMMDVAGIVPWAKTHPMIQVIEQHIRSRIDDQTWQVAWEEGRKLTIEQAMDLAFRLGGGQV
jgi:tetratricopeptide (TPR) repeat protein